MNGEYMAQPDDPDFERQVTTLMRRAALGEVIGIQHGHVGQEAIRRIREAREKSAIHRPGEK